MATVTGLELINKVMLYRRQPAISTYSDIDPEHVVTLNAINMAKEDILGTRRWEFDLRHDGQLITKATASSLGSTVTMSLTAGSSTATVTTPTDAQADLTGDCVTRIVPTGDTDYSSTAFRVTSAVGSGVTATALLPFLAPKTFVSTPCDLIYAEYFLPDTVREVVRASFDQNELSLEQLDPTVEFDECIPSPHLDSGRPRVFSVGGFDRSSYITGGTVPDPKLRAIVWPVPDDEYVLSYSYYYNHADLTNGASSWSGIPVSIVNDIVWQAVSLTKMALDGDYAASHFSDMAQSQASVKYAAYSGSSGRRHTVKSWDTGRDTFGTREGFPGRLIG